MAKGAQVSRLSKEERVAAIVRAARHEFELRGYEQARVADIAARIGVVEGTVFHYFGSKRKLVLHVMEEFYSTITSQQREGLRGILGTRNRLHFIVRNHFGVIHNNADLCRVILQQARGVDKKLSTSVRQLNRDYSDALRNIVQSGIEAGDLRADTSATLLRDTIFGCVEHTLWSTPNSRRIAASELDQQAEQLTELVYAGIDNQGVDMAHGEIGSLVKKLNSLL